MSPGLLLKRYEDEVHKSLGWIISAVWVLGAFIPLFGVYFKTQENMLQRKNMKQIKLKIAQKGEKLVVNWSTNGQPSTGL